jgi:tetratricopeptide (TPR) repeat protein
LSTRLAHLPVLLPAALVAALCAAASAGASVQDPDLDGLLSRALVLHQSGDLEGAAALYVQILRAAPGAARLRSNLGAAYAGLGRYDEAIEEYRKALAAEDDPAIRRNLSLALQKAGRPQEAAEEARRILERDPANRDAVLTLADSLMRLGDDAGAIEALRPAVAAAPDDKAFAYLLGTAFLEAGRTAEAQAVMDRVFRDDSPEAHVLLGSMYSRRKEWSRARGELEKARTAAPKLPLVNFLYGEALMKDTNDWEGAKAAFRDELALNPSHFEANLLLGTLLREEGRHEEALVYLLQAARVRGDDLALRFSLGAAYLALGRVAEAEPLLEGVAAAAPNHLPTHLQLAVLYHRLGRAADAARERAAVQRLQKDAEASTFQGVRESVSELMGRADTAPAPAKEPKK